MTRPTTVPPPAVPGMVPGASAGSSSRFGRAATARPMVEETAADSQFDAWQSLAAWLRDGRLERGLSVADVARTTKIQARILEDLEAGHPEELPADVFVRGFVRNYARCVGLSEAEALARYAACGRDVGPVASPAATAVAELYAPVARKSRMSTVVPVAPGSSAAEVHAHGGQTIRRAATSPGISTGISMEPSRRAATSPG
ncbi:MAG TPA: helix-turn-helix transcriptional regulator, partial [Kofleriaceae bacterium]|nr:helix-turn-helix transcriptional regulator [Kofleriaceae bacterium]